LQVFRGQTGSVRGRTGRLTNPPKSAIFEASAIGENRLGPPWGPSLRR